ncbi:hydroxyacid dehydrogenase [Streptomyces sp. P6-2-1]|uniref:hydroxyacid dehydrogenase n=1 Tax=unclassified Streptomyces TaxID=2593676 RepID=UPI003D366D4E
MHEATDRRPRALLAMSPQVAEELLTPAHHERLSRLVRTEPGLIASDFSDPGPAVAAALAEAEVLLTCWGVPRLTADVLARAPKLRAVVHAAGTVKGFVTDACWERGLTVSSAAGANALPVAEYTLAAILFSGKRVLDSARGAREPGGRRDWHRELRDAGNYRRVVGLVGASRVGRRVLELLRPFDFDVLLHDPYVSEADAAALGARSVELAELCAHSSVVSVHAPELPSTHHLIGAAELAAMPDGATLINTSRGSLIDESALLAELGSGRLSAVLDVTDPEPPLPGSPFYTLPNVLLTPHVAGSLGNEVHRMADHAIDEVERWTRGEPFAEPVAAEELHLSA